MCKLEVILGIFLGVTHLAPSEGSPLPWTLLPQPPALGLQAHVAMPAFYLGAGLLNLGSQACPESTEYKPSPSQPLGSF